MHHTLLQALPEGRGSALYEIAARNGMGMDTNQFGTKRGSVDKSAEKTYTYSA